MRNSYPHCGEIADKKSAGSDRTIEPHTETHSFLSESIAAEPNLAIERRFAKAKAYSNLSASLSTVGNREDALTAIQEAVVLFQAIAAEHPGIFNAELAASLRTLSSRLAHVGRREEALTKIEKAVNLHRALAKERPAEFNVELASTLSHHSNRLSRLNRPEEAVIAIQESVDLYRTLAEWWPDSHRAGLAASLFNLHNCLSKTHLLDESLEAIQEASSIYRDMAISTPASNKKNLILCLTKLSNCLKGLGRNEEALAAVQEAANIADPQEAPRTRRPYSETVTAPDKINPCSKWIDSCSETAANISHIMDAGSTRTPTAAMGPSAFHSRGSGVVGAVTTDEDLGTDIILICIVISTHVAHSSADITGAPVCRGRFLGPPIHMLAGHSCIYGVNHCRMGSPR